MLQQFIQQFIWQLAIFAASLLIGLFYIADVFSFAFLGPEAGSERVTVELWSYVSIGLAVLLLASCMSWFFVRNIFLEACIVISLIIIAIVQIPPIALWVVAGAVGYVGDALVGMMPHFVLLALIFRTVIRGRGTLRSNHERKPV